MGRTSSDIKTGVGYALVPLIDAGANTAIALDEGGGKTVEALQPINYAVIGALMAGVAMHAIIGMSERGLSTLKPETQGNLVKLAMAAGGALGAMADHGHNAPQAVLGGLVGFLQGKATTAIVPRFHSKMPKAKAR